MNCEKCDFYYENSKGIITCHFEEPCAPPCDDCDDEIPFWGEEDDCLGE